MFRLQGPSRAAETFRGPLHRPTNLVDLLANIALRDTRSKFGSRDLRAASMRVFRLESSLDVCAPTKND